MERVATRRLIDAAAELEPADRALVALWVHRGFDDDALAGVTGITAESLATRRVRVVERLSAIIGLPPDDIVAAFAALGPYESPIGREEQQEEEMSESVPPRSAAPARPAPASPVRPSARRRGGRAPVWTFVAPLVAIAAVIVVVVIVAKNGDTTRGPRRVASRPTPPSALTHVRRLAPLPGGPGRASGQVGITHANGHLDLQLRVTGLPDLARGRYEVWLYNSIIDAQSLGFLTGPSGALTVSVPGSAARYRFIDVEREPPGDVNPSGESVLRASNPV